MRFQAAHILGQSGRQFEGELRVTQIRIGPDLGDTAPVLGPAQELSGDRVASQSLSPGFLLGQEAGENCLVVSYLGIFGVEPHLQTENLGAGHQGGINDLSLVVLPR